MARYRDPLSLTEAIYRKNTAAIDVFIKLNAGINEPRECYRKDKGRWQLPLTQAIRQEDISLARRLLSVGAKPNGVPYHETPLEAAIYKGSVEMMDSLFEAGADLNYSQSHNSFYSSYMEYACRMGNAQVLKRLIEHGGKASEIDKNGYSLVHSLFSSSALDRNTKENLKVLRDHGADLLYAARIKETPSHYVHPFSYAVALGDEEMVGWFLDAGADPNLVCENDMRISNLASIVGLPVLACTLLGASPQKGGVVRLLLQKGARLDVKVDFNPDTIGPVCSPSELEKYGGRPLRARGGNYLMLAAAWADVDCVKALLEHGMDPNARDENGATALKIFFEKAGRGFLDRPMDILAELLKAGADPNFVYENGNTVMHGFTKSCNLLTREPEPELRHWAQSAANLLLDYGCNLEIRNSSGLTALEIVQDEDNLIVDLLRAHHSRQALQANTGLAEGQRRQAPRL